MAFLILCYCHRKWNPHPCGFYGDVKRQWRCSLGQIEKYGQRISRLLFDGINLPDELPLVDVHDLTSDRVTGNEVPEAIQFRSLDRRLFE